MHVHIVGDMIFTSTFFGGGSSDSRLASKPCCNKHYGIAAGSAAVMTPGTELCRPDDVHDIFGRIAILD
ncbi:MAG: hypothetical protein AAFQ07_16955 [Chloroflexota bacterium]